MRQACLVPDRLESIQDRCQTVQHFANISGMRIQVSETRMSVPKHLPKLGDRGIVDRRQACFVTQDTQMPVYGCMKSVDCADRIAQIQ